MRRPRIGARWTIQSSPCRENATGSCRDACSRGRNSSHRSWVAETEKLSTPGADASSFDRIIQALRKKWADHISGAEARPGEFQQSAVASRPPGLAREFSKLSRRGELQGSPVRAGRGVRSLREVIERIGSRVPVPRLLLSFA